MTESQYHSSIAIPGTIWLHLTPSRIHRLLSPEDASPIDVLNLFSDTVRFSEIMNRDAPARSGNITSINISTQRHSMIETTQNRPVHISANAKDRDR
jgi:hypothetical protein